MIQSSTLAWREGEETELEANAGTRGGELSVQKFSISIIEGPSAGRGWASDGAKCSIGSHPSNDVVIEDRRVSRFHCDIVLEVGGARMRDLGSRNGTYLDGVRITDGWLRDQSLVRLGSSALLFRIGRDTNTVPLSTQTSFGSLVGRSVAMRAVFAAFERGSRSDVTFLLEGETGTGKEEAARAIHEASPRAEGPFVVVDCSAMPKDLLESELFGHERGAFTGAQNRRIGAFEASHGGTIFLDEIGELPLDLQPKLLRVLESKTIRRVGSHEQLPVDIRVVAATNRNLRSEVNEGRFRPDLYYRIAVIRVVMPSLRERPEDIPDIAARILERLELPPNVAREWLTPEMAARLQRNAWPGNVRELRNYLEHYVLLQQPPSPSGLAVRTGTGGFAIDPRLSYAESRRRAIDEFERQFVTALLEYHRDNVAQACRETGLNRAYMYRLLQKHGLR